ncbi:MAG: hypothetical protein PVJ55_12450 [Anaerolineae bacterium]
MPKTHPDLDYDPFQEDRCFAFQSLDDALQAVVECVAEERGSQWKLGAVVASTVDTHGKYGTYKKLAEIAMYTTRRLKTFEVLHRTFPPALRFPDQPLLLYETALQADNPVLALKTALDEEWSPRELADAISKTKGETVSRVKLFGGEAVVVADGTDWQVRIEADRDWPDGDGVHRAHVTVRQIMEEEGEGGADGVEPDVALHGWPG